MRPCSSRSTVALDDCIVALAADLAMAHIAAGAKVAHGGGAGNQQFSRETALIPDGTEAENMTNLFVSFADHIVSLS